jgi:site-specific DNA-methyltransferase (adenine-specific)
MNFNIYNEECIKGMSKLESSSVDMVLCDLPYGTTRNPWDTIIPFEDLWECYNRIVKPNGAICLFAQTPFDKKLGCSNIHALRYEWIWEKPQGTGFLNANKAPLKNHENILVFYRNTPTYNPQFTKGKPYIQKNQVTTTNYNKFARTTTINEGQRFPCSVLKFNSPMEKLHPTQKPLDLCAYFIRTYTNEGDTVLDNCMGSGTTGVAAICNNRNFIGFELEEKYFKIAEQRLNAEKNSVSILNTIDVSSDYEEV